MSVQVLLWLATAAVCTVVQTGGASDERMGGPESEVRLHC